VRIRVRKVAKSNLDRTESLSCHQKVKPAELATVPKKREIIANLRNREKRRKAKGKDWKECRSLPYPNANSFARELNVLKHTKDGGRG